MGSSDNPEKALEQFQSLALVEDGWIPIQGYLILVFDRDADAGLFDLLDIAERFDMDGDIRIVTDVRHDGELRDTIHLESVDRVEPPLS
ncbi:hypothetical protein [Saliphagus infecundisoli]|uniref:Uncharacterized protein n=1 Tax=Saliphagus infecundisoli TaxID=1849069 RepID=A0ABD5QL54_9EURY|nr:hypothetical protein [Saliphagus infecundisoli]